MVGRDIALAEMTGGRVHVMCLTTRDSVERVRQAKAAGVRITAEVTPHHLALTDEALKSFSSHNRVFPPLVPQPHVTALIEGIKDGTIDAICSDHTPLAEQKRDCEIDLAPPGISGFETAFGVAAQTLVGGGHVDWSRLIGLMTIGPAGVLKIDRGTLRTNAIADVVILDPDREWTVNAQAFHSRGMNSPFHGKTLTGCVDLTMVAGSIRYSRDGSNLPSV
jgi:dihydroorotase